MQPSPCAEWKSSRCEYLANVVFSCLTDPSSSAAAETRHPRKNLVTAMRTVFFRISICYASRVYLVLRIIKLV